MRSDCSLLLIAKLQYIRLTCVYHKSLFLSLLYINISFAMMTGNDRLWPFLVGHTAVPACLAFLAGLVLHESPKYLHIKRGEKEKAEKSLHFYHGPLVDPEPLLLEYSEENELANRLPELSLKTIFSKAHLRRAFFVSLVVILSLDIVGSDFVSQYSTSIFLAAGIGENLAALAALLSVLPGILAAALTLTFIERIGRRPLILAAMFVGCFANILLTISGSR